MEFTPLNVDRTTYYQVTRTNNPSVVKKENIQTGEQKVYAVKENNRFYKIGIAASGIIAAVCAGIGVYKHAICKGLNKKLSEVIPENNKLSNKINEMQEEFFNAVSDNRSISKKLDAAREEVINAQSDNLALADKLNKAQIDIINKDNENNRLLSNLDEANNKIQELTSKRIKVRFKRFINKLKFWK